MEANLQEKDSVTAINAYAPTSSAEDEKWDGFYNDIERATSPSGSKYKTITGDFKQNLKLKQKKKTSKAWEQLEHGREMKEEITQLNLQRNTN